ncbi:E3 ubiquitin-protein ligase RNF8-like isoform X1 [Rhopalosiphum maidis]|uniref:E3 ubiquitin-protein ligase RNF8-like isoform X1 n=1 Tax=Rhopalosiphum maidis TaxID=43146 RepID=UPI000EFDD6F8|nr:E3 ubiquitin-protein ligase RNF8-like isoform X1 [Rhopalosiphum maidis]
MLEDIKNVMNSKRPNNDSNVPLAFIQDTKTGELYEVKTDSPFLFGRLLKSSVVIEELYISRSHSTITYASGQFLLKDNGSSSGTYLNYKKIANAEVPLKNGDLIAYTDKSKTWDFIYKFCLLVNSKKKSRLDEETADVEEHNKLKISKIRKLQNLVKELKNDNTNLYNDTKTQMNAFNKMIKDVTEMNEKLNKEIIKLQNNNRELNNELNINRKKCAMQKAEMLDAKTAQEEEPVEIFKTQIIKLLENDFQCSICNEVMFRASTASCNHTFCESCLKKWLSKSPYCPVCRGVVQTITYCLILDTYITNLCDILGGTIKEQRVTLQHERNGYPPQVAKRGRRRANPSTTRTRREQPMFDYVDVPPALPIRNSARYSVYNLQPPVIDIVDLTNNTSR